MEKLEFQQLEETLYHEKLENGLEVYVLPKPGFNKTFATFATKYGSVDDTFVPIGGTEMKKVPDGIAHFLEHKMFEKEDGDVFQLFSKQGASANAFTSFTRTAYLFSSTSETEKNLQTLIDMVQKPYFTEETVEKEKGIIGQEIKMYDDNPDWRLYFGVIENLYKNHPVRIDIAGTVESIADITADLLYECYNTFYHPGNMLLFVTGPVDPAEIIGYIRKDQEEKNIAPAKPIERAEVDEPDRAAEKKQVIPMNVGMPKCMVGVKAADVHMSGEEMLKKELSAMIGLDMLFGKSSANYEELIGEGLIDDTFQYDYSQEHGFGFALAGSDTEKPDELADRMQKMMLEAATGGNLSADALERSKKKRIGGFLRSMNSPDFIANQFTRYAFNEMDLFRVVPVLESLTLEDIKVTAADLFKEDRMTVCQVVPEK